MTPDHGTPIKDALAWLRDNTQLTKADFEALTNPVPTGVHTLGDLPVVLERGEIADKALEKKLRKVLEK